MALGQRAKFEGTSVDGTVYEVIIWAEGASAAADYAEAVVADGGTIESISCLESILDGPILELKPSRQMFELTYSPETNEIAGTLAPSSCSIEFYVMGADEETLLTEILQFQQKDFYVTIRQHQAGKTAYTPYWKGVILQDQIEQLDAERGLVAITAVDGLTRLKDVPYNFGNTITDGLYQYTPIQSIIFKALETALPTELWDGTTEPFLTITNQWFTNDQTFSTITDPTFTQFFDVEAFTEVVDKFDVSFFTFKTCFEVLEEFAKALLCRVYLADGHYYFEQIPERSLANIKRNRYNKNNTGISNGIVNAVIPINQTRESARLAGGVFQYFPALKLVEVTQEPYNSTAPTTLLFPRSSFASSVSRDFGLYGQFLVGTPVAANLLQQIRFDVIFNVEVQPNLANGDAINTGQGLNPFVFGARVIVNVRIKLSDAASSDVYYYNGVTWVLTGTPINVTLVGRSTITNQSTTTAPNLQFSSGAGASITTAGLPATGRIEITFLNYQVQKLTALSPLTYASATSAVTTGTGIRGDFSTVYDNGEGVRFFSIENTNANIGDFEREDLGTILLGDGALQSGHVFVKDASNVYQPTTEWNYRDGTDDFSLAGILVTERLGLQRDILETFNGQVYYPNGYAVAIDFESTRWIPLEYSFSAGSGIVNAQFIAVNRFEVSETVDQNLSPALPFGIDDGFTQFLIGGILIGDGKVGNQFHEVDGTIETQPFRTINGRRDKVRSIEAAAGENATVSALDEVLYFTWSGGNGNFTLNLPELTSALDGLRLVIKLDDDFTADQDITITPTGGDLVNGESSLVVDGSGSFPKTFTMWAVDGGWVI